MANPQRNTNAISSINRSAVLAPHFSARDAKPRAADAH
jgi:hypothetical protein